MRLRFFIPALLLVFIIAGCSSPSRLTRGKAYFERNKFDRAIEELERAANEQGDVYYYIETYTLLGDAYARNGESEKAASVYRNALQMIHLQLREISSQRMHIRRELNSRSKPKASGRQDEDMRLGDEEWKLKESAEKIKIKLQNVWEKR